MIQLFKRNNSGIPIVWQIDANTINNTITIEYGIFLKGKLHSETYKPKRNPIDEVKSRIKQKRKEGYKELYELYDNAPINILNDNDKLHYLNTYLPKYNLDDNYSIKPMLAKIFEYNKAFKDCDYRIGQWKINGERCIISAKKSINNIFKPIELIFKSRIGTTWDLQYLEEYLLEYLKDTELLDMMIEENVCLDGELYLPSYSINNINHFIKDKRAIQHKLLQFWCYDLAIENYNQTSRLEILNKNFNKWRLKEINKNIHYNNENKLVLLTNYDISNDEESTEFRNKFINYGFEGIILRNPKSEYEFGRRNSSMFKYKKIYDGLFEVLDILPEGDRRNHLPKVVCKNDINDSTFTATCIGNHEQQAFYLKYKERYIGSLCKVEYRERSGVNQVPFHQKVVELKYSDKYVNNGI